MKSLKEQVKHGTPAFLFFRRGCGRIELYQSGETASHGAASCEPAYSRLENELGVRLFERNSSRVFLTEAGRCFLNEARVVLQHVSQATEAARQVRNGWAGTVRVGITKGLGDIVSRIMNEYLRHASRVEIDVLAIASGFQSEAILHRNIDVGFMRPPIDAVQLVSASLFLEPFSVVLRKASPLAKRKVLRVCDLADETLLLIDRRISPGVYDRTLELFREQGIEPKTISTATISGDDFECCRRRVSETGGSETP
jgi:DNA-binding transcriptional LysR family regulator